MTLEEAFKATLKNYWDKPRFRESKRYDQVQYLWPRIGLTLGHLGLEELSPSKIRNWHSGQMDSPIQANRALEVLSRVYTYANEMEWTTHNPVKNVKSAPERKRRRYATADEIRAIGVILKRKLNERLYRSGAAFLLALLFTGSRPKALVDAKWSDLRVQGDIGVLVSKGKMSAETGEEDTVIFPKYVMDVVLALPKRSDGKIFHPSNWRRVWSKVQDELGIHDLWARDLRRTFATVGMSNGVPLDQIARTLNQKSQQTTLRYAQIFDETRNKTVNKIAKELEELIG